jgi:hypothetical protein
MQFPPVFRHVSPPQSKYSAQHPVPKHPQSMFSIETVAPINVPSRDNHRIVSRSVA